MRLFINHRMELENSIRNLWSQRHGSYCRRLLKMAITDHKIAYPKIT